MKILIAEDEPVSRRMLAALLAEWGYDVLAATDGKEAWAMSQRPDAPRLAILDWKMPEMDGIEVCQRIRAQSTSQQMYVLLLTAKGGRDNIVVGLQSGANDYVIKPFDPDELRARIQVGLRVVELQTALAERVRQLEEALARVKHLQGLLPICSYCKKIRDDQNYWQQVEAYITRHSEVRFSHGVCPECFERVVQPEIERVRNSVLAED